MGWISNVASTVGSFISSIAPSVGTKIGGFASKFLGIVEKLPIPGLEIIKVVSTVASIVNMVVKLLDIETEMNPEILGAKVEQCDKSIEEFDDVEAYIKYLKNDIVLDKQRFDSLSMEERFGCKIVGMSLETKAIENKLDDIVITPESLALLIKLEKSGFNIEAKTLLNTINALKESGITDMDEVVAFFEGKGGNDRIKTGEVITKELGDESFGKVLDLQEAVREFEED
ncbi:MAG: hypothetical protein K6F77_10420 [Lachnospiraceae bacterium]|nr:hypothetical protein [Lachnospiraceae bacterium]